MHCTVYRSTLRDYTYLYLARSHDFEDLPDDLRDRFGPAEPVMELDLAKTTHLARVDIDAVRRALADAGHYLQLPPRHPLEEEIQAALEGRPFKPD
ncbi:YcgL domain-containing protein [Elongatibacter sediminis]|uniref:YcgL domain-containing protein V3330_09365 n=1 Tax=Elongatibacter sediminis TaxID=3119006 RepID=A0AAW9RJP5_9GAMM